MAAEYAALLERAGADPNVVGVLTRARAAGLGDVVDGWEPEVDRLREAGPRPE